MRLRHNDAIVCRFATSLDGPRIKTIGGAFRTAVLRRESGRVGQGSDGSCTEQPLRFRIEAGQQLFG